MNIDFFFLFSPHFSTIDIHCLTGKWITINTSEPNTECIHNSKYYNVEICSLAL